MKVLYLAAAWVLPVMAAPSDWVHVRSPNFELYSNAGLKEARRTIEYFEQVRDFFDRTKSSTAANHLPVTIVAFRNEKDYRPYSPSEGTAAYFIGDENRDYIVMGGVGAEHFPIAVHEYMHLLVRQSGMKLPVWLNEGLAEVYSTLKPIGNKITVGSIPPGRAYTLSREKWMNLGLLLSIRHDSPEYNEKDRKGMLYAQSWMLAHMLMLSREYMPRFSQFINKLHSSQSGAEAFQTVYGKSLDQVTKDLRQYYNSNGILQAIFDTRLIDIKVDDGQLADAAKVELLLSRVTGMLGRHEEAERRLSVLAANSQDAEVPEALAHLYWSKGDMEKARSYLGKAVDLAPATWKTYWDFARLSQNSDPKDAKVTAALRKAIDLNPDLADARLMLGYRYYSGRAYGLALATLAGVKKLEPEQAFRFYMIRGHSALQLKDLTSAKAAAEAVQKWAKTQEELAEVKKFSEYLEYMANPRAHLATPAEQPISQPDAAPDADTGGAPRLQRREVKRVAAEPVPQEVLEEVIGMLADIECKGSMTRLHVVSGRKVSVLLVREAEKVYIKGVSPEQQVLRCGSTRKPVNIKFVPNVDKSTGTIGDAREIAFED